jgi:hypothetical protein
VIASLIATAREPQPAPELLSEPESAD